MGTIYRDNLSHAGIYDGDLTFIQHNESWVTLILATGSLYNWIAHFLTAAVNILKFIGTSCPAYFAGLRLYQKAFLAVKWSTSSSFLTSIDMWSIGESYCGEGKNSHSLTRLLQYVSNRNVVAVSSVAYRI